LIISSDLLEVGSVGKIFTHSFVSIHLFNIIPLLLLMEHNYREYLALKSTKM
jgi:hypothetical protein